MKILHAIPELREVPGPVHLAIGVFDGVHLGHCAVIRHAIDDADESGGSAVVLTFDPHPVKVLRPDQAPRLITSTPHKIRLIRKLGVAYLLIARFDRGLAGLAPEDFVADLHRAGNPLRGISVGHRWSFGRDRAGNVTLLSTLGERLGFDVRGVQPVEADGRPVSSTLIRSLIESGDLDAVRRMLGRRFSILGTVEHGSHIGRKIGYPTANLSAHNEQFPPNGVYAVRASFNGEVLAGIVNIGIRPTFRDASGERLLELHLFDFNRDLYGQDIEVFFHAPLRPEMKFSDIGQLRAQIAKDIEEAKVALDDESSPPR